MGLCGLPGWSATRSNFSVATAAGSRDAERAAVSVATDAGSLAVTVIYTDAGWRVVTVTTEAP